MYNTSTSCTITKPTVSCSAGTEDSWRTTNNSFSSNTSKTASCTIQGCPAGQYLNGNSCTTCPEGKYCPNQESEAKQCPTNTTSAPGQSSVTDCYKQYTATFIPNGATSI